MKVKFDKNAVDFIYKETEIRVSVGLSELTDDEVSLIYEKMTDIETEEAMNISDDDDGSTNLRLAKASDLVTYFSLRMA